MSLIDTIYDMQTGKDEPTPYKYLVTRTASGPYVDGNATTGATTTFLITALVGPVSGRDLQILEDAGITSESKKVLTDTELRTRVPGFEPDVVTIKGESWIVQNAVTVEAFDEVIYAVLVARASMQ